MVVCVMVEEVFVLYCEVFVVIVVVVVVVFGVFVIEEVLMELYDVFLIYCD